MNDRHHTRFAPAVPGILFLAVMVFFAMMPRMLLSPLLLRISADLGISYDRASLFFLSSSAGFVLGLFSSGFVARRLTHKWTLTVGVGLAGVSLMVLSRLQSVTSFHLMLFAGNWAVGLYPGSGIASVSMLAPDVHRGKALAIHECGPNFSYILAPVITAALAPAAGWRGVALVIGAACAVFSLAYALFSRAGGHRGEPPNFRNLKELARNRAFWVISILFVVAATAAQGIYNVLPTYLVVAHELSERFVNNLVGASRITGFIAIVTAGTLADRYGFRPVVAVILTVTGISTVLLGIADGGLLIASVFLQPLIVAAYFPVALNALMEVTAPERRNLAIAMAIPMATLASAGIAPPLFTAAGARGWFSQSFVVLGALVLLSIGLLAWMPAGKRR